MNHPKPNPYIMNIPAYVGGRSQLLKIKSPFKLSANENPFGASPQAIEAYKNILSTTGLALYPDSHTCELRQKIADTHNIDAQRIVCGNGSGELLHLITQAYLTNGDEAISTEYGFLIYKLVINFTGAKPITVPELDLVANVDNILEAITSKTKIVFLANPNNPTGTFLPQKEIERLHRNLRKDILLVLDGAYVEYIQNAHEYNDFHLVNQYENVVAMRTFSKIYGLAALRLGWVYCPQNIADILNHMREPFNVNTPAQKTGIAALCDQDHIKKSINHNTYWREQLYKHISACGFTVISSEGNFLLIRFGNPTLADKADKFLCHHAIISRQLTNYNLPDALRLSIGTEEVNHMVMDIFSKFSKIC